MLKANKNLITTAIFGAIVTTLLFTVKTSEAKDTLDSPEQKVTKRFNRLDINDDQFLDLSELLTPPLNKAENIFTRRDNDEFIVQILEAKDRRGSPEQKVTNQFNRLDINDDQFLDRSELLTPALNRAENRFTRRDNNEFTVKISEVRDKRGSPERKVTKQFNRLDINDDQFLELSELLTPALNKAENRFTRRDNDEDGFLTFEEATVGRSGNNDLSEIADEIVQCVADIKAETGNELILDLSVANFQSPVEIFDNTDTSGDGLLDLYEVLAEKTRRVTVIFDSMDSDDTGSVPLQEYLTYKQQRFATRRAINSCVDELTDDEEV